MTGYETILATIVLARMRAAPAIVDDLAKVRRAHRTFIPRSSGYSVHVVDGYDQPRKSAVGNRFCAFREGIFILSLFARDDAGPTVLDALKLEVMRRLDPDTQPYPAGIVIEPGRIIVQTEIADADAVRVDMNFDLSYPVAGEWSLELPT